MSRIIFVSGGARSGKSRFAEKKAIELGNRIGYIATGIATDDDMADRIRHHQESRPAGFVTLEGWKDYSGLLESEDGKACDAYIFDCVTVGITNLLFDRETQVEYGGGELDYDTCSMEEIHRMEERITRVFDELVRYIRHKDKTIIFVSNELGMGLVASYRLGNIFRDIAGRINQMLAGHSDEAYLLVSGLPLQLK